MPRSAPSSSCGSIWSCLCAILTVLIAIHFLSYSETLREMFAMPDMSSYPSLPGWLAFRIRCAYSQPRSVAACFVWRLAAIPDDFGPFIQPPPVSVHRRLHLRWRHPLVVRWRGPRCSHRNPIQGTAGGIEARLLLPMHSRTGRLPAAGTQKAASSSPQARRACRLPASHHRCRRGRRQPRRLSLGECTWRA